MKITLEQAIEFAQKTKELGCCSLSGQSLILLVDEIRKLENEKSAIFTQGIVKKYE